MVQDKIFVSYSRKDKDIVHPLVNEIEAATGLKCWIDLEGIESGDEFEDKIIKAIDRVSVVLFMLSDNAMNSAFARNEIRYAKNCGKKVVPVVIDGGMLRGWFLFIFGGVDYIDISQDDQKQKLFKNLRSWFDLPDSAPGEMFDVMERLSDIVDAPKADAPKKDAPKRKAAQSGKRAAKRKVAPKMKFAPKEDANVDILDGADADFEEMDWVVPDRSSADEVVYENWDWIGGASSAIEDDWSCWDEPASSDAGWGGWDDDFAQLDDDDALSGDSGDSNDADMWENW